MSRRTINYALAVSAMAVAFTVSAQAAVSRTFVSTGGNDANTSVNCSASANCRTFAAALTVTEAGGEIVVVNSGGYGPFTISQPVTISAIGVVASVSETSSGSNAITINTTGNVTINGLLLHGEATGNDGILVEKVNFLRLYNMTIENFVNDGVDFTGGNNLAVYDSDFNDNGHDGILLNSATSRAYINNTEFDDNAFAGCDSSKGAMTVADSSAHYNQYGFYANGGTMTLVSDRAIYNTNGLAVAGTTGLNGPGTMYMAYTFVANNTNSYNVASGGILAGSTPGTNVIAPGQSSVGTLSAAMTLL